MKRIVLSRIAPCCVLFSCALFVLAAGPGSDDPVQLVRPIAKSPAEEKKTIQIPPGFQIDLVASEPQVVDPVAMAFDERGRLFVAELRGYPNGGVAGGDTRTGIIKMLEDKDGDGVFESSTVYADGLGFPTSVMPYKDGVLVAVAPDLIYLEDRDGDGKADSRRTLYTGFGVDNIEQLLNGLQWGMDNWVHACVGSSGGSVQSAEKPATPPVVLRNRGIRFHPEEPGSLQPTSGGGQFALAADDWGHWFTNTNSQHLRQIVLPDHYLKRNPYLAVNAVTLDIPDHGEACKVFRISPFEAWRVERTRRRKDDPAYRARLPATELVPGGFVTSGCSPIVYTADAFPDDYQGNTFICDPANNLIHRDRLEPDGAVFKAVRVDQDREFLASSDNWFRPVCLTIGPDGALYIADFYREGIETPLSLPPYIRKQINVETCGKGRIWRIARAGHKPGRMPRLDRQNSIELVQALEKQNPWWRLTAQRLLIEKQIKDAAPGLIKLLTQATLPQTRAHALWTLHGLQKLPVELVIGALSDSHPGVRMQALIVAETFAQGSEALQTKLVTLATDPDPMVRFQAAFTLGTILTKETTPALARILEHDCADKWTVTAALSSAGGHEVELLRILAANSNWRSKAPQDSLEIYRRLASLIGARADQAGLAACLQLVASRQGKLDSWQLAILEGMSAGLARGGRSLNQWWKHSPTGLESGVEALRELMRQAVQTAQDSKANVDQRLAAVGLLGSGPFEMVREPLKAVLQPSAALPLQLAAVHALSAHTDSAVADILLEAWGNVGPAVRREILEAQFARKDRLTVLLSAIEKGRIRPADLDPARREQLKRHTDSSIRTRAAKVLQASPASDRKRTLDDYRPALALVGDVSRGKDVFKRVCSSCHRLENVGNEVGPNLLSALGTKTPETLLMDVFDPSREVDPRFLNYLVMMRDGRTLTGMVASESANSITLRRAEKAEDTVLRDQIEQMVATQKSLMPENLETQLSKQDFADVVAYMLRVAGVR